MSYDIPNIHIADGSLEQRGIEAVMNKTHIDNPAEAILQVLREQAPMRSAIDETWGAFSSPEDSAILDEAMKHTRELRQRDRLQNLGT